MKPIESKWEGKDGITFQVQGWEPDGDSKALVALVHGLGEHVGRYAHVGRALTDAGYTLIGFDLRGHGKSGGARGHTPSLDAYMQDIRQFFQFLSQRYPSIPHFLYGHSLGGLLSLTYAIQYGEGLKGIVVTGPALRSALQEQKAKVALAKLLGSLAPAMTIPSGLDPQALSHDPEIIKAYIEDPLVHDKTSMGFGKAALNAIDLCFSRAKEFTPPLLLMHGKADRITYPSGSEDFVSLAREKNRDVTLKLWDGMYHEIHNEPGKAEVIRFMLEWLDNHLK
ncbi:MAG: lysophospholipase [Chloroflexi bacterium]|nr:lysophospholipase [Chloroflexota bacterium]